ncbi:TPA: hypothetical protein RUX41_002734 [Aeromonas dhakensis]|uniref:DUF7079 family protein n=1 Tax=Aeromonas dhakensis TaxID=196024 RepID=UPI0028D9DD10|nr:hypothetical protein [Aeromonas dhakensis]
MADQVTDQDLCEALSDIFIDNEVDYAHIASIARHFPLVHVEWVLFEWVAPICCTNGCSPVPPVWSGFQSELLWHDIQALLAKQKNAGLVMRFLFHLRGRCLRRVYADEWRTLSALLALE